MDINDVSPVDYKYIVEKPDPSFSPRRNQAIIQETINETDRFFKSLENKYNDDMENRIDILSSYGVYRFNRGTKNIKQYLGKKGWEAVIGEKILEKVRILDSINKLTGRNDRKILV